MVDQKHFSPALARDGGAQHPRSTGAKDDRVKSVGFIVIH
jgi:hypothetical protein